MYFPPFFRRVFHLFSQRTCLEKRFFHRSLLLTNHYIILCFVFWLESPKGKCHKVFASIVVLKTKWGSPLLAYSLACSSFNPMVPGLIFCSAGLRKLIDAVYLCELGCWLILTRNLQFPKGKCYKLFALVL